MFGNQARWYAVCSTRTKLMDTHRAKAFLRSLRPTRSHQETMTVRLGAPTLDGSEKAPTPAEREHPVLLMVSGPQQGMVFSLRDRQVVGRGDDADIVLADDSVSRTHARIVRRSGATFIEDLESRNGTFVEGRLVRAPTMLREGAYVRFGPVSLARLRTMDDLELGALRFLHETTLRDPLTRLHNRRYLDERLRSEFSFATRHEAPLALLLVDIDHFKRVNDEHGHQAGDFVLRLVAASIQRLMRPEDVVARYGGEEFVVIARNTGLRNGVIFAERIRTRIAALQPAWDGQELGVTVSVGVTAIEAGSGHSSAEAMLQAADDALYDAKTAGRNRISTRPPQAPAEQR
jgi:two-component system, cell cycle response regulator